MTSPDDWPLRPEIDLTYVRSRPLRTEAGESIAGFDLVGFYFLWPRLDTVRLAVATEEKDLAFHLLHRKDGSRIKQRYFCAADDQPL